MKNVKNLTITALVLISFSTFAHIKVDKEPIMIKRGFEVFFESFEQLSAPKETPFESNNLPEFHFGNIEDINEKDAEALKTVSAIVLPKFYFGNETDFNVEEIEALKSVDRPVLPEFHFNSEPDFNANEIEALKTIDQPISLPLFYAGTPEDLNVQEIEALKEIPSN